MNPEDGMKMLNDPDAWNVALEPRANAFAAKAAPAPWLITARTVAVVAVVTAVAFLAVSTGIRTLNQPPVPAVSPTPELTPAPSPSPRPTQNVGSATCENLVSQRVLDMFTDMEAPLQPAVSSYTPVSTAPFRAEGIVCTWMNEGASNPPITYAYGPITDDAAAAIKQQLLDGGGRVSAEGYERYIRPAAGPDDPKLSGDFAFIDGYWAYSSSANYQFDILREVVSHAEGFASVPAVELSFPKYTGTANCRNLLDSDLRSELEGDGWAPLSEFSKQVRSTRGESTNFLAYGGIACLWTLPDDIGDAHVGFYYGPISAEQSRFETLRMLLDGATTTESNGVTYYTDPFTYLTLAFGDGYWAYGSSEEVLDGVIRNAPAF